jgi:hypothetical protein
VIGRPHNNYGPRAHYEGTNGEVIPRFILWGLAGKPLLVYGDGQQTRDFTYVTETVACMVRLLECEAARGGTFNICRGAEVSVVELAHLIRDLGARGHSWFLAEVSPNVADCSLPSRLVAQHGHRIGPHLAGRRARPRIQPLFQLGKFLFDALSAIGQRGRNLATAFHGSFGLAFCSGFSPSRNGCEQVDPTFAVAGSEQVPGTLLAEPSQLPPFRRQGGRGTLAFQVLNFAQQPQGFLQFRVHILLLLRVCEHYLQRRCRRWCEARHRNKPGKPERRLLKTALPELPSLLIQPDAEAALVGSAYFQNPAPVSGSLANKVVYAVAAKGDICNLLTLEARQKQAGQHHCSFLNKVFALQRSGGKELWLCKRYCSIETIRAIGELELGWGGMVGPQRHSGMLDQQRSVQGWVLPGKVLYRQHDGPRHKHPSYESSPERRTRLQHPLQNERNPTVPLAQGEGEKAKKGRFRDSFGYW